MNRLIAALWIFLHFSLACSDEHTPIEPQKNGSASVLMAQPSAAYDKLDVIVFDGNDPSRLITKRSFLKRNSILELNIEPGSYLFKIDYYLNGEMMGSTQFCQNEADTNSHWVTIVKGPNTAAITVCRKDGRVAIPEAPTNEVADEGVDDVDNENESGTSQGPNTPDNSSDNTNDGEQISSDTISKPSSRAPSPPTSNSCTNQRPNLQAELRRVGGPPQDGYHNGFGILEGPIWYNGALYISEIKDGPQPDSRILKYTPEGGLTVQNAASGTNGLALDHRGRPVAARHRPQGSLVRFSQAFSTNGITELASGYQGSPFNSPNDLIFRSDGNAYFTDPDWQAPEPRPQSGERAYRLSPNGDIQVIPSPPQKPNGIALSPDEKTLYISGTGSLKAYRVGVNGVINSEGQRFGDASYTEVDGMTVDCAGNLYLASGDRIIVLNPNGDRLGDIQVRDGVTNVAFGGSDFQTLFITRMGNDRDLYRINLGIKGRQAPGPRAPLPNTTETRPQTTPGGNQLVLWSSDNLSQGSSNNFNLPSGWRIGEVWGNGNVQVSNVGGRNAVVFSNEARYHGFKIIPPDGRRFSFTEAIVVAYRQKSADSPVATANYGLRVIKPGEFEGDGGAPTTTWTVQNRGGSNRLFDLPELSNEATMHMPSSFFNGQAQATKLIWETQINWHINDALVIESVVLKGFEWR